MMVNILAAVTGGILDYGATSMECDRVLKVKKKKSTAFINN